MAAYRTKYTSVSVSDLVRLCCQRYRTLHRLGQVLVVAESPRAQQTMQKVILKIGLCDRRGDTNCLRDSTFLFDRRRRSAAGAVTASIGSLNIERRWLMRSYIRLIATWPTDWWCEIILGHASIVSLLAETASVKLSKILYTVWPRNFTLTM